MRGTCLKKRDFSRDAPVELAVGVQALPQVGVRAHGRLELLGGRVEPHHDLLRELQLGGGHIARHLVRLRRSHDNAGDAWLMQQVRQPQVRQRDPHVRADTAKLFQRRHQQSLVAFLAMTGLGTLSVEVARARSEGGHLVSILPSACEQALHERVVGDDADAVRAAERQDLDLDAAKDEVVAQLVHGELDAGRQRCLELLDAEVAHADVAHLAFALERHQIHEGLRGRRHLCVAEGACRGIFAAAITGEVCHRIGFDRPMHHVQINGIHAEARQRRFAMLAHFAAIVGQNLRANDDR
mmetsp:Transcript_141048/g.451053  ORF Transcript_141048/g.451053 Transcript_141048/m.451053 type:complete len:297 (-) Transcript_141048:124-1014(-)